MLHWRCLHRRKKVLEDILRQAAEKDPQSKVETMGRQYGPFTLGSLYTNYC